MDYSVCCIKGCEKKSVALGLCVNHWRRNKKYGSPVAVKSHSGLMRGLSVQQRFDRQVKKSGGCWLWAAATDKNGYGIFRATVAGVEHKRAHRASWALSTGQVLAAGDIICHKCDNPRCVNPEHLFVGTHLDNMRDKIAKGRARVAVGTATGHAVLTEEQARSVLADPRPYAQIAADYGITASTVGSLKQRKSWKHIDGTSVKAERVSPRKGVSNKITPEIVKAIRASHETGRALSEKYGTTPQTICDIRKRRSWAHID